MTRPPLDQAAYDTGAQAIGFELMLALYGGPKPDDADARFAPGRYRAADMARGAIAEATVHLAYIAGPTAAIGFVHKVLFEIVQREALAAFDPERKEARS